MLAGANAAALALCLEPLTGDRASSYLGVLVDDLTLQGVTEPYRMLTARAEHRLALRSDNAVSRLGPTALQAGLLNQSQQQLVERHLEAKADAERSLATEATGRELGVNESDRQSLARWALREDVRAVVRRRLGDGAAASEALEDAVYAPYVERQDREVRTMRERDVQISAIFNFAAVPGLSNEMIERLSLARPETLSQASRLQGITPAALAALHFATARAA